MQQTYTNFRLDGFNHPVMHVLDGVIESLQEEGEELSGTVHDLGGAWMLPAFNDSHCHILPTGLDLMKLHLGACTSPEEVLDAVRDKLNEIDAGHWLHAVHYDQTKFEGARHLTRIELDELSSEIPILLRHSNGHASVANSAALRAARIEETISDPSGGTYVRDDSGRLNGVLLERAHEYVTSRSPEPSLDEMVEAILRASAEMSRFGITAASDMMTGRWHLLKELEAYRLASERGARVRFTLWMQWSAVLGPRGFKANQIDEIVRLMDPRKCAIGGLKIFSDGAIGSATAAIYGRFETDPDDGRTESGQLIYSREKLVEMVGLATKRNYTVAVHAIGDRAVDATLDAFEKSGQPFRHRLEHAMLLSDEQIARIKHLKCFVTMQPEFLHRFGHAYRVQLGERAFGLKRFRSVLDAEIPMSFNSDRPIVKGDPWVGIITACQRPEGFDPAENITRAEAIDAYTRWGAIANGHGYWLGQLKPGYVADFCLYGEDPMTSKSPCVKAIYFDGVSVNEVEVDHTLIVT